MGFPCGSAGKESTCNVRELGSIPGLGRSPGEQKGYALQYYGLENSMDCVVHGAAKSWTQPSNFHFQAGSRTKRGSSPSRRRLTGYSAPHAHVENHFTNEGPEVKTTSLVESACTSTSEAKTRTPFHHCYDLHVILCDHWDHKAWPQGSWEPCRGGSMQGESSHDSQASGWASWDTCECVDSCSVTWQHLESIGFSINCKVIYNRAVGRTMHACMHAESLSCVWVFTTLWTVAHQAPLSREFSRQEYWSGLPCPTPGDLPNPGITSLLDACIGRQVLYH